MSTKEMTQALLKAKDDFYAWSPSGIQNLDRQFRCHHQPSRPIITERQCQARAGRPDIFRDGCSGCPRWRHYYKLAKKAEKRPLRIAYE